MKTEISIFIFLFIVGFAASSIAKETEEQVVQSFMVDKKNKTISYALTKPVMARLRVGSKSGPLYRTLVNWEKQKEGKQTIEWDGMDNSRTFDILGNKNFTFSFNYYLPGKEEIKEYVEEDLIISDYFVGRTPPLVHESQQHQKHKREHCKDLEVIFELPFDIEKTKEGVAKVKDNCPIVIKIPEEDKNWFRDERFSVNIFVDDVFVKGEALGYAPYAWNFNHKGINEGLHLITVNLKGFNDHIAVGSLPIYVGQSD